MSYCAFNPRASPSTKVWVPAPVVILAVHVRSTVCESHNSASDWLRVRIVSGLGETRSDLFRRKYVSLVINGRTDCGMFISSPLVFKISGKGRTQSEISASLILVAFTG